jgi:uncharacterized protein (DUF58 family)
VELSEERLLEGDELELVVRLEWSGGRLELFAVLPDGVEIADGANPAVLRLPAGNHEHRLKLRAARWGAHAVGFVHVRTADPLGLIQFETSFDRRLPLRVYPHPEQLRKVLRPLRTQAFTGMQVAPHRGEGIEFVDLRQFRPGDASRRVNWRASARRGELWVNEFHVERNADVVLLLDSFAEARAGTGGGTGDRAVRAAAILADHYLRSKDRVGLVGLGGALDWLPPSIGLSQLYRIVDALLESAVFTTFAWGGLRVLPRRLLPPQALVLALTPLLDDRTRIALLDLRSRGYDVAAVELSPLPFVRPGKRATEEVAFRIWKLELEARRAALRRAGIAVASWDDERSLASALEEVESFRRRPGRAFV